MEGQGFGLSPTSYANPSCHALPHQKLVWQRPSHCANRIRFARGISAFARGGYLDRKPKSGLSQSLLMNYLAVLQSTFVRPHRWLLADRVVLHEETWCCPSCSCGLFDVGNPAGSPVESAARAPATATKCGQRLPHLIGGGPHRTSQLTSLLASSMAR